jgi:hypothetical protein
MIEITLAGPLSGAVKSQRIDETSPRITILYNSYAIIRETGKCLLFHTIY